LDHWEWIRFIQHARIFMAGPMWGFNRALGDKFLFNLTLGPVYQKEIDNNQDGLKVYGDLRFCYIFN